MFPVAFLTITLLVAQVSVAAPLSAPGAALKVRGIGSTIASSAIDGASGALVNNLLTEIESLFKRDGPTLTNDQKKQILVALVNKAQSAHANKRGFGSTIAGNAASGAAGAVVSNLLSEIESLFKRHDPTLANDKRGFGSTLAGNAISGASSAAISNLLSEVESLFKREELATRASSTSPSSGKSESITTTLAGNAANGAAGALVSNVLSEIESLFKRDGSTLTNDQKKQILVALVNKAQSAHAEKRGFGSTIAGNAASGAAGAVVSNLLSEIESLFKRHDPTLANDKRGFGSTLAGNAISGASSAAISNLLSEVESLFKREELATRASSTSPSSGKSESITTTLAGNAANGAAGALVSNVLSEIESLFKRDGSTLTNDQKKQILVALVNKAQSAHAEKRGFGSTLAGNAISGASSAAVGNILSEIESLFKRDSSLGIKPTTGGFPIATPGNVFNGVLDDIENLFKRESSLNDLD